MIEISTTKNEFITDIVFALVDANIIEYEKNYDDIDKAINVISSKFQNVSLTLNNKVSINN